MAEILSVEACPWIKPGTGRVVLATFSRQADNLVDVSVAGSSSPIRSTPNHPFYSLSAGEWKGASDLRPGERLLTRSGETEVRGVTSGSYALSVFNLSVEGDHCYWIGNEKVLVHNSCGAANNTTRVGRWMGEAEHAAMMETKMVQQSYTGTTHVASPANPLAFQSQAKPGSLYVEFDVPSASVRATQEGWGKILGPNTVEARLAIKQGLPVPQLPPATNIQHTATKFR